MNLKRILAREWLFLIGFLLLGAPTTVLLYFPVSSEYKASRQRLYDELTKHYQRERRWQELSSRYNFEGIPKSKTLRTFKPDPSQIIWDDEPPDTSRPFATFEEFSKNLHDPSKRKSFYDSIPVKFDIGDFHTFEAKIAPPSSFSGISKFLNHLLSRWYWMQTWLTVLLPYALFIFVRSLVWSVKTLKRQ